MTREQQEELATAQRKLRQERSLHPRRFVEGCTTCERIQKESQGFGPWHDASRGCESGWYEHCSCDTCF